MKKKIFYSLLSGFVILIATWVYQNYDFTLSVEDGFFSKLAFWRFRFFSPKPKHQRDIIFLNTGKDLALVNDTTDWGTIAVTDREKLYRFMHYINSYKSKPSFTVIDLRFYDHYSSNPVTDSLLGAELIKNGNILIPIIKDKKGNYKPPIFKAQYGYSEFKTYSFGFNKFQLVKHTSYRSIPVVMEERLEHVRYKDHYFYTTRNNQLCLSAVWPSFYMKDANLKNNEYSFAQYYNLGEVLPIMSSDSSIFEKVFENKILIIGNFEEDQHPTDIGMMAGPVLLANIYLSIINNQHIISILFLFILFLVLSALSYIAWFKQIPEIRLKFNFIFSIHFSKFVKGYISYFGCMFIFSLLMIFIFNVEVAFFLPSLIFAGIEYFRQKKYKPGKY